MSDTVRCPFCGRDPFHYVDNGVGMEAVAVTCCELGDLYFRGARPAPETAEISWDEFREIGGTLGRLRSELSAAKEAEAAAQLAVLDVREQAVTEVKSITSIPTFSSDDANDMANDVANDVIAQAVRRIRALPISPTPTEEKVRRLVVAARAVIDDRNNVALRGHDNLQAALSEVEALIGKPQQSKGG
jgi:hypothetical protein